MCLADLVERQHLVHEGSYLATFYQLGHLLEPFPLTCQEDAVDRLVESVGRGEVPLQRDNAREPTKGSSRLHPLGHKVPSNRFEYSVYPRPSSIIERDLEDVFRGVVYRHIDPKFLQ